MSLIYMKSQRLLRQWLGVIMQQAMTLTDVDQIFCWTTWVHQATVIYCRLHNLHFSLFFVLIHRLSQQNDPIFAHDFFKYVSLNEKIWILNKCLTTYSISGMAPNGIQVPTCNCWWSG